jgi:ABC-type transport system involved in multi-copper enzyme maturation permease subunit
MRNARIIFARELKGFLVSPIAYIVISIFLIVTGWFFFSTFFLYNQAELRNFFGLLPVTFSFIVPAVTMRLFSEEFNAGSYELLKTQPVTSADVVLGSSSLFSVISTGDPGSAAILERCSWGLPSPRWGSSRRPSPATRS